MHRESRATLVSVESVLIASCQVPSQHTNNLFLGLSIEIGGRSPRLEESAPAAFECGVSEAIGSHNWDIVTKGFKMKVIYPQCTI